MLQLTVAVAVGTVAVLRGRVYAVPLVAVAIRLLLDPQTQTYYSAGLVWTALLFDLGGRRFRLPWTALGAGLLVALPHTLLALLAPGLTVAAQVVGDLRLLTLAGLVVVAVVVGTPTDSPQRRWRSPPAARGRPTLTHPARDPLFSSAVRRTGCWWTTLPVTSGGGPAGSGPGVLSGLVAIPSRSGRGGVHHPGRPRCTLGSAEQPDVIDVAVSRPNPEPGQR